MLVMIATGLLVWFIQPPRSGERRTLLKYSRHDWGDVHFWLAVTLGALVLVHVALHWSRVCSLVQSWFPRRGPGARPRSATRRNLAGAALQVVVAGLIGGFLGMADRNVVDSAGRQDASLRCRCRRWCWHTGVLLFPHAPSSDVAHH